MPLQSSAAVIDSRLDPVGAARAAQALTEGENPAVPEPGPSLVALPGGWIDPQGKLHRTAEVRELTGVDEEAMAKAGRLPDGGMDSRRVMECVFERCTLKIGTVGVSPKLLQSMHLGDREAILLGIYRTTYGDDYETRIYCPVCPKWSDVVFELNTDIEPKVLKDPAVVWRDVTLKGGRVANVRLISVADQAEALANEEATGAEMNSILLSRIIRTVDGIETMGLQSAQTLSSADRRKILKYVTDNAPSAGLGEAKTTCPKCQAESTTPLNLAAIFLES